MLGEVLYGREYGLRFDVLNEIALFTQLDIQKLLGDVSCTKSDMTMEQNISCSDIAVLTSQPVKAKTSQHFV